MSKSTQQELWRLVNPGDLRLPGDQYWSWQQWGWMPVSPQHHGEAVQEGTTPVRRRMKSAEARREYDAALPALLKNMGISSAAESALDSVAGPDGANDMKSQRTGKISPNQNGDTQRPGVLPGAAAEDALQWTREQPRAKGFYWWRGDMGGRATILEIQERVDYSTFLTFLVVADSQGDTLTEAMGGIWWGPIQEPAGEGAPA